MEIKSLVGTHDQAGAFIEGLPRDLILIGQTLAHYRIEEQIRRGTRRKAIIPSCISP